MKDHARTIMLITIAALALTSFVSAAPEEGTEKSLADKVSQAYREGYRQAFIDSYREAYREGHKDGYKLGFEEGKKGRE